MDLSLNVTPIGSESEVVLTLHLSMMEEGGVDISLSTDSLDLLFGQSKSEFNKISWHNLLASVSIILFHDIVSEVIELFGTC